MKAIVSALVGSLLFFTAANAFTLSKYDPHHILKQMGFAMGTAYCPEYQFNWLAHDLVFDWAEAKLGEDIEIERHKQHYLAGVDDANGLMKANLPVYCAELWTRFGEDGDEIPGLILRK